MGGRWAREREIKRERGEGRGGGGGERWKSGGQSKSSLLLAAIDRSVFVWTGRGGGGGEKGEGVGEGGAMNKWSWGCQGFPAGRSWSLAVVARRGLDLADSAVLLQQRPWPLAPLPPAASSGMSMQINPGASGRPWGAGWGGGGGG